MIKLLVIGHLGRDCVTNSVNGKTVMNFSVAHTEKYKDIQGNLKENTTWVDCSYWSEKTAIAPYLKKGTQVYVEGAPEAKTYQKNDGSNAVTLSLRIMNIQLLGSGNKGQSNGGGENTQPYSGTSTSTVPEHSEVANGTDDLPF